MNIYKMYEDQKVPWVHRLPEIVAEKRVYFSELVRIDNEDDYAKLYFVFENGDCYNLTLEFPKYSGIHISGERKGFFKAESTTVTYRSEDDVHTVSSKNGYTVNIVLGKDFLLELCRDGIPFYRIDKHCFSFGIIGREYRKLQITTPIHPNEKISGFGEKYNKINQVGEVLPLWNDDTGYHAHPEEGAKVRSYKNVPIFHSSLGFTFFCNSFYGAHADLSVNNNTSFELDFNDPMLDIYFWKGTVEDNLDCYTNLTGRPVLPPKWAHEFWAGGTGLNWQRNGKENFINVFKEAVDGYERMGTIPAAFYGEADPSFNTVCNDIVKKSGSRMLCWNHPGVDVYINRYSVQRIKEIFRGINDNDIPMFRNPETNEIIDKPLFFIDYSHPKAVDLIYNKYDVFWNWGIKGAMVDFGEFVECKTKAYNGMLGDEMHNFNAYCYSKTIHDAWQMRNGDDYILFARAGCAGVQKWVCFFGGDQIGKFYGLRQAYYGGLNASLCGLTIWGSDIGSLSSCDSEELYLRWLQFGAFSPLMRTHGNHNPWNYGKHCVSVFKKYFWLRKNLLDYIYGAVIKTHLTGAPIMSIMSAYYPDDDRMLAVDDQYMFGDSLLICPVLYEGMFERDVVLPAGDWTELLSGVRYNGGQTVRVPSPIETCPVFVRSGAVIPVTLGDELSLTLPISEKAKQALLVSLGEKNTVHRVSVEKSFKFSINAVSDGYVLRNVDEYEAEAVLIYGDIKAAFADGVAIEIEPKDEMWALKLKKSNWKEIVIKC